MSKKESREMKDNIENRLVIDQISRITPINPDVITEYEIGTLPAYLSNGVVGMRVSKIPFNNGRCSLNGFVGSDPVDGVQSIQYVPYPLDVDINIGSYWMSMMPECTRFISQFYDFSCGELTTKFEYSFRGVTAEVTVLTYCSRSLPNVIIQQVNIIFNRDALIQVKTNVNMKRADVCMLRRDGTKLNNHDDMDGAILFESRGGITKAGIAYYTHMAAEGCDITKAVADRGFDNEVSTIYDINAVKGREYVLQQCAALVPSVMHSEPDRQAIRLVEFAMKKGFQTLRDENIGLWQEIWKGRVIITADDRKWQEIADAAYFYVHTSVHEASPCSTGLFGLGMWDNYHYFKGHVFWDIEIFTQPALLLTAPYTARTIMKYRYKNLESAKKNAVMSGYRGAMFPWESSIFGEEVTPVHWPDIFHEQHINTDIAYAMSQYIHATGDDIFTKESAWPVISNIAEWLASRVVKTERGYEILHVTGIDEGASYVDNNSWTNCGAILALDEAIKLGTRLGYTIPEEWTHIRDNIYLPIDEKSKILHKYDDFKDLGGGYCPDSLAAFFPLNFKASEEVEKATYNFFLNNIEGYIGYPMLSSPMGVFAARTGNRKLSLELFERGVADYVIDNFRQFDEFGKYFTENKQKVGPYLAHAGGFLLDLIYGLTGIKIDESDPMQWCRYPVILPEGWSSIETEIWVRGRKAILRAVQGEKRATICFV